MKIVYDAAMNILRIRFNDAAIAESDEEKPGMILDYNAEGGIVGLEILDASTHVTNPEALEYAVVRVKVG